MMNKRWIYLLVWVLVLTAGLVFGQDDPVDLESSKVRSKAIVSTVDGTVEEVTQTLYALLLGMDIPVEKVDEDGKTFLRIHQSWIAGYNKEFGEFFQYEKKAEDALFWDFDKESLESGRQTHLSAYIKMPGSGFGGMAKAMNPMADSEKTENAYFIGRIDFEPSGRAKTKIFCETLYFIPDKKKGFKACKSTGKFEKEMIDLAKDVLILESRVFRAIPDSVKKELVRIIGKYEMTSDQNLNNMLITQRLFMDRQGDHTIKNVAKLRGQLMASWLGTYRAVFLLTPEGEDATRVKPVFVFMAINGNNGKRQWEVYPTKWVMEEDILSDLRTAFMDE